MNNKFDLERFKAGDLAVWELKGDETNGRVDTFIAIDDDRIIVRYEKDDEYHYDYSYIDNMESYCTMKPKEEYILVHKDSILLKDRMVYPSIEKAEEARQYLIDKKNYMVVKIK